MVPSGGGREEEEEEEKEKGKGDEEEDAAAAKEKEREKNGAVSQKNILEGLEDLPPEDEYSNLSVTSFMGSLGR